MGIEEENVKTCFNTGLVVDIKGLGEGEGGGEVQCIAIRADIDALPMGENNEALGYRSETDHAHMCGHDGHTAMLLAAASVLAQKRISIPKQLTVRLLFQPAEEGEGGALPMIAEGCLHQVEEVYGGHNEPEFPLGHIVTKPGSCMAGVCFVDIQILGRGGHGSQPWTLKDPVNAAAHVLVGLNAIQARNVDAFETFVLTICSIQAGTTNNVFPDSAFLKGSIRFFSDEVGLKVKQRIEEIASTTAKAH